MRILSWLVQQFRRARALRRGKRLLKRYEMIYHSCGVGPVALSEGESCPFCELSWSDAMQEQLEFERISQKSEQRRLDDEQRRRDDAG